MHTILNAKVTGTSINPDLGRCFSLVARGYWCQTRSGDELLQRTVKSNVLSKGCYC